ncbi:MAG: MmgE/PrpD family protein [Bacillota bacterium]|nr:MmgE/PrpD family protein [Bacillota bacterium]
MEHKGFTRQMAAALRSVELAQAPAAVRHRVRQCVLDFLGVALGASHHVAVQSLLAVSREVATAPQATILGRMERTDMLWAALVNGTMAHILDFDDTHLPTILHGYTPTLACALALGEHLHSTGSDVAAAFLVGYETAARVARAICPSHYDRGWHVTGTAGTLGAAAAAARLLRLDLDETTNALGIAATQAAGLREMFGTMSKPFHAGRAAQNGLLAALLARQGFTSSPVALEAPRGFCAVFSDRFNLSALLAGWGTEWEIMNLGFKPYPCGVVTHAAIDSALAVRELLRTDAVSADSITDIYLKCHPLVLELTGKPAPQTGLEGKFSVHHCVAVALLDGIVGPQSFTTERVLASDAADLRARVSVAPSELLRQDQAEITVRTRGGKTYVHRTEHASGTSANPLGDAELVRKFRHLVSSRTTAPLPGEAPDLIYRYVMRLDELDDITRILELCRPEATA